MLEKSNRSSKNFQDYLSKLINPDKVQFHQRLSPHEVLFSENAKADYLYYLVNGSLILSKANFSQKDVEISRVEKGNFFGFEALFPYGYYYCTAKSISAALICAVPKATFLKLFNEYNKDMIQLMDMVFAEFSARESTLIQLEQQKLF